MMELYIILFLAHLVGDFVIQPDSLVKAKEKWWGLLLHTAIVTLITAMFLLTKQWWMYLAIFVSHGAIDAIKNKIGGASIGAFIFDQIAHLLVLLGIVWLFPDAMQQSLWVNTVDCGCGTALLNIYIKGLVLLSGFILTVLVGNVLISKMLAPLVRELNQTLSQGLTNGGKWIGILERALSFILICFGQAGAIGFIFAAKSILRFGEIKDSNQRKEAEYIIIGTFMSFGWAILMANITMKVFAIY